MDDPVDFAWNLLWSVVWIVGTLGVGAFVFALIRDYLDKNKPKHLFIVKVFNGVTR